MEEGEDKPEAKEDLYAAARADMVASQIAARGVMDERVLDAMRVVPRHLFVPERFREHAYEDRPIEIGEGQTVSQPYMVGLMTDLAEIDPEDRVLEIGTGSGYQAAILARLAKQVITIERRSPLAESAARRLAELGYANVRVFHGDGSMGRPEDAPYNAIIVTAAAPHVPHLLRQQLADGGRLITPVGSRDAQRLLKIVRQGSEWLTIRSVDCRFVPLIGQEGWEP